MIFRTQTILTVCMALMAAGVTGASSPKATAPVEVTLSALDPFTVSGPLRIRLHAVPRVDVPSLKLVWSLPSDVTLVAGPATRTASARAGQGIDLIVTVQLPDQRSRPFYGGAVLEWPNGLRQVKSELLMLPPSAPAKAETLSPVARDGRGRAIVEHIIAPSGPASETDR